MSHPVVDKVARLARQLRDNQTKEKFELCDSMAGLLRNIAAVSFGTNFQARRACGEREFQKQPSDVRILPNEKQ